jgi:hypothetical protein
MFFLMDQCISHIPQLPNGIASKKEAPVIGGQGLVA